jgi:hypothetical protein
LVRRSSRVLGLTKGVAAKLERVTTQAATNKIQDFMGPFQ